MIGDLEGKRWVSGVGVSLVPLIAARLGRHQLKLGEGELCTKLMVRVPQSIVDKMTEMLADIEISFNLIFMLDLLVFSSNFNLDNS